MLRTVILFVGLMVCMGTALADTVNGGFETGDLSGWSTVGNVEVLQATNFQPNIIPPEGDYFCLISNGYDETSAPDGIDIDGNGDPENDTTELSQVFTSTDGQLCFYWSWLTDEEDQYMIYDDVFAVYLDGNLILSGSVDKSPEYSPFPNVSTDDVEYTVNSPGPTNESYFGDGRSEFQQFCVPVTAGSHELKFVVADQGNHIFDSGLLVDDIKVIPSQAIPEFSTFGIFVIILGTVAIIAFTRK